MLNNHIQTQKSSFHLMHSADKMRLLET